MTTRRVILRGVLAGLCAGLLAAVFFATVAEGPLQEAIAIEQRSHESDHAGTAHEHDSGDVAVSRSTQRGPGLFLAVGLAGAAFGALLAVVFLVFGRRSTPWRGAVGAGAALFTAIVLVPWLKYPPNPPGVGRAATLADREALYLIAICCTALLAWVAVRVHRSLAQHGWDGRRRAAAAAAAFVVPLAALLVVLPGSPDPVHLPSELLWRFRLASLAGNTILWLALIAAFGLLVAGARAAMLRPRPTKEAAA